MASPQARAGRYLTIIITVSLIAYCASFYLPLTSKAKNNIFYIGVSLPTAICLMLNLKETLYIIKTYIWVFLSIAALSTLFASDTKDLKAALYLSLLFFSLKIICSNEHRAWRNPIILYSLLSTALFIHFTVQWFMEGVDQELWERYSFFLGHYINPVYTCTLITSSLCSLWLFLIEPHTSARSKAVHFLSIGLLVGAVLLCTVMFQSRSTLLGFSMFLAAYALLRRQWSLILGMAAITLIAFIIGDIWEVLLERGLSYRPEIWKDAISRVVDVCGILTGCGSDGHQFAGQWPHAHSAYVSTFYRAGLLGILFLTIFLCFTGWHASRRYSLWLPIAVIGWGSVITTTYGVISSPDQSFWVYFWIPTFLAILDQTAWRPTPRSQY
mgnify:CR=1 FL=1